MNKKRPLHLGQPPSRCGRATVRSAWVPLSEAGTADCGYCTGGWASRGPSSGSTHPLALWRVGANLTQGEVAVVARMSGPGWRLIEQGISAVRLVVALRVAAKWPEAAGPLGLPTGEV